MSDPDDTAGRSATGPFSGHRRWLVSSQPNPGSRISQRRPRRNGRPRRRSRRPSMGPAATAAGSRSAGAAAAPGQPPPAFDPPTQAQPYHQAQDQAQYQAQQSAPVSGAAAAARRRRYPDARRPARSPQPAGRRGRADAGARGKRPLGPAHGSPCPISTAEASEAIAPTSGRSPPPIRKKSASARKYALCATIDDIAQNLPNIGHDGAEWARRSLVVQFFRENIGGDRFWQLVDDVLARPAQNAELIELFAACLAAGFEGRFRVMPDGKGRLQQIMARLYGALEHPRSLSMLEIAPQWQGDRCAAAQGRHAEQGRAGRGRGACCCC